MTADMVLLLGLLGSVLTALAGAVDTFPPTWKPYVTAAGVVGMTTSAYLLKSPRQGS